MKQIIVVQEQQITSANTITVQAGTNCPQGGDTGHGGRTLFGITDQGSTDMRISVDGGPYQPIDSFTIILGGDSEKNTFVEALQFGVEVLTRKPSLTVTIP
jgi:hypothetical protein